MSDQKSDGSDGGGNELRSERASIRRDPRADPDDEPIAAPRVDVFQDRTSGGIESVANAALTLRRELAKLHQQAAAVERTLEDQRRERGEWIERLEGADAKAGELEEKLRLAEAEAVTQRRLHEAALADLEALRAERDGLAESLEEATKASGDVERTKAEAEELRAAATAAQTELATVREELAEVRRREQAGSEKATASESEVQELRERLDRTTAELTQARSAAGDVSAEAARLREELAAATESAASRRADLEREQASAKEEIAKLEQSLTEARAFEEKLAAVQAELVTVRIAAAEGRSENTRLERDVEAARHARDVANERAAMAEREVADARANTERREREREAANATAAAANARAAVAERARLLVEDSVKQLRDEVTSAFARWRGTVPSMPPPAPTASVPASPLGAAALRASLTPGALRPSTPAPKISSVPPEAPAEKIASTPPEAPARFSETPPSPSEIEQATASAILSSSILPDSLLEEVEEKEPARSSPPTPPRLPPRPGRPSAAPAGIGALFSVPPPTGSSWPSEPPPSGPVVSEERDLLIGQLASPKDAHDAAIKLLLRPEWLRGRPPLELLVALGQVGRGTDSPIFELARAWEREPLCRGLVAALRDEPDPGQREQGAWLVRQLPGAGSWPAITELVSSESEPAPVRGLLLEAAEALVTAKSLGWSDVGELLARFAREEDASLRRAALAALAALERSDDKRRVLLEYLRADDDEIVLAGAVQALAGVLPVELEPAVAERLLGHPSERVQKSVLELIERSKAERS
jgi:hypothetical protein